MIIFKTTNIINNKIYIGKACGFRTNNSYLGSGSRLKVAIGKYGKKNFRRVVIDVAENRVDQNNKEIFGLIFMMRGIEPSVIILRQVVRAVLILKRLERKLVCR